MMVARLIFLCFLLSSTWAENELGDLLDTARNRMRCVSDPKCLETKGIERILRVTNLKSADNEDLSMILAHHILHGDSSCTVQLSRLEIIEEEVMRAVETEDIPGMLRVFKRILKDGGEKECLGTEGILKEMSLTPSYTAMQWVRSVLAVLMDHVLKGHCLEDGLPPGDSLDNLFSSYGDACSPYMSAKGLGKMITDLESSHHHNHDHTHHEGHSHDHDCDHQHDHNHQHDDHKHDHSKRYHHDHSDIGHDHNHDHSNNYLRSHNHSDHDHHNYFGHDHDHPHNHSSHDHDHPHNHSDHDHHNYFGDDHDYPHNHSSHDHDHPHNHSDHEELIYHNHFGHDDGHPHNDSDHDHAYSKDTKYIHGINSDKDNNKSHHHDTNELTVAIVSLKNGNFSNLNATRNGTAESDSVVELQSTTEMFSDVAETIISSKLSDLWHPTTLASEETNVVSHIIPPLSSHMPSFTSSKCLSAESLVNRFGSDRTSVSKSEFLSLCPVIVQQRVGDACSEPYVSLNTASKLEVYGYSSACVLVLCLSSLSGVLLLPLMRQNARHYVIAGFQGLAFSTLASDALLHLLPEFLGLHSHDHSHGHDHLHEETSFPEPYLQLLLGFFVTTYVLFMTEAVLCALSGRSKEQHGHGHGHVNHISEPTLISLKNKSTTQLNVSADQSCSSLDTEIVDMDTIKKPPNLMVAQPVLCGLTSVALVITLGDALHNFGDGLAIGAAFSANIRGGLSTAAAALCHELPHELGDFVVLLSTGLSYSKALWLNFLSGLTCFVGLYVGILVGDNDVARKWVMAVTASTFLYVALAEMVPELREHRHGSPFKMLLVKNIGIIVGLGIMIVISVYEHEMA